MLERTVLRRALLARPVIRVTNPSIAQRSFQLQATASYSSQLPNVAQTSFWKSLIPKPLRKSDNLQSTKKNIIKEWNPATFYIWIFLLIGSMSIQMIAVRNQHATFMRRADAKIDLLREIVERLEKGEKVDVEGLLGTGNKQQEAEWEQVLKDIESEDELWNEQRRKPRGPLLRETATPVREGNEAASTTSEQDEARPKIKSNAPRGFY